MMRISCLTVLCVLTTVSGAFAAPSLVTSANTANVGAVSRAGSLRAVKSNVAVKKYATPEQPSAAANADTARMASIVGGVGKMSGKIPSSSSSTAAGGAMLNSLQKQVSDLSSNYDDLAAQVSNANTRIDAAQTTADTAQTTADTAVAGIDELRNTTVDSGTISALGAALAQKANAADVYTKSESNELLAARATNADLQSAVTQVTEALAQKAGVDQISSLQSAISTKADTSALEQKLDRSELDTLAKKSEVEALSAAANAALAQKADRSELENLALGATVDAYTKSETDGLLNAKVDNSSFDGYKTEMNAALAQKAGVDQISSLQSAISTKADTSALAQKANAADVYTKSESDTKVADLKSWTDENKLNKSDYDTFVANTGVAIENVYTKSETDAKLAAKANAANIYTRATIDTKLETKADTSALAQKADAANVYTKTESDATYVKKDMGAANKNGILTTDSDGWVKVDHENSGGIFDTLTRFDGDIATLSTDVSDLRDTVGSQGDAISGFGTTLGTYQGQVATLSTDVSNLRDTVGSQGDTISGLSSDVAGLHTDVAANTAALTNKANTADVVSKTDFNTYKTTTTNAVDKISGDITTLNNTVATKANTADVVSKTDFNTYKNTTTNTVNKISGDITTLNNAVATKANASDLTTLQNTVSQLQQTVTNLQNTTTSLETQCQVGK